MKGQAYFITGVPGLMIREDMVERMLKGEKFAIMDGGAKVLVEITPEQRRMHEFEGRDNARKIANYYRHLVEAFLRGHILRDAAMKGGVSFEGTE